MIRANKDRLQTYLPKLDLFSPLWCKAIRLFGIYLLEKKNDSQEWLATYRSFNDAAPEHKMIQNLLLESIIFSNDTEKYLNDLWEEFKKEDAKILNDFFEQFFFKATLPNPAVLQLNGKLPGITLSQLATYHRVPKFIYWIPVMRFINGHLDELVTLSRKNAIRTSRDWLEYTPTNAIFRNTAAELGVKLGQWLVKFKEDSGFAYRETGKDFYQPMLLGFREKPAEVKALSLKLSRRVPATKLKKRKSDDNPIFTQINPRRGTILPNGPNNRVDDDFEEACLEANNLVPMMQTDPELAKEILLAIMICDPESVQDPASHRFHYNINEPHQWFPPFYSRGPFLSFFRTASGTALDFVITLTNFAIEEWKLEQQARKEEITSVILDLPGFGKREYYGDNRVYYWFRDVGNAPHSLISVLMALEKFLIELIDSSKEPEEFVRQILERSECLAMIGLLSSIGRYSRKLFRTVLRPLLECFELYQLESGLDHGALNIEGHQNIGTNFLDTTTQALAWQWNALPHRKISIRSVALPLMLSRPEIHDLFQNKILPEWSKLNQEYTDAGYTDGFLVNMIAQFNRENYVSFQQEEQVGLIYQEPEQVTKQLSVVRSSSAFDSGEFTFAFSRQQDLEQNKDYDLPALEALWITVQEFYAKPEGGLFEHLNHRLANLFAGIGILVTHRSKWQGGHPEYMKWIEKTITEVLEQTTFDLRASTMLIGPGGWEGFAARFVPPLFAEAPDNRVRRKWLAAMALNGNNEAVGHLFKALSEHFKFSDPEFIRLQNLAIQRAQLVRQQTATYWEEPVDWNAIFKEVLEAFVDGETPAELIDLTSFKVKTVAEVEPDEIRPRRRRGRQVKAVQDIGLDLQILFPSLQFPDFETISDAAEKKFIFDWYKKLIEVQTAAWGTLTAEDNLPLEIALDSFDHWFVLKLSVLLPQLTAAEAEELWKPLLAYGNVAAKWLTYFLDHLLVYNYEKPESFEALGAIWNEMIDLALMSPTWKYKDGFFHDHWDLWQSVLGISNIQMEVWKLGHEELLLKFSKKTVDYITRYHINTEAINKLAILLRSPGAKNFIVPGVLLVAAHLKFQDELDNKDVPMGKVRVPFEHYDSVAATCSYLWSDHQEEIKNDERTLSAFKQIVIHLVAKQNPIRLDLQDRLIE